MARGPKRAPWPVRYQLVERGPDDRYVDALEVSRVLRIGKAREGRQSSPGGLLHARPAQSLPPRARVDHDPPACSTASTVLPLALPSPM